MPALAQEAGSLQEAAADAARPEAAMRLEVNATALPRIDSQDAGFQAPRVDLSLLPSGGSGVGVAVGMSGLQSRSGLQPSWAPQGNRPAVDLGVHLRHNLQGNQIDLTAWRRMQTQPADAYSLAQAKQPLYGARVEMKLTPMRQQGLLMERGFIGVQLEGDARIAIKRKDGRPMVYYRTSF